jgi:hypothetical protein
LSAFVRAVTETQGIREAALRSLALKELAEAQAHAATNGYWISYAGDAQDAASAPSGVISWDGAWHARCPQEERPAVIVAEISDDPANLGRPWRRKARAGIYDPHVVHDDPRSNDRSVV